MPHLEITKVRLLQCNTFNNDYQQDLRALYTFIPNNWSSPLLDISPKSFIFLRSFNSEFSYTEVWFTDRNDKPLEIEDKINYLMP